MYHVRDGLLYLWIFDRWRYRHMNRCETINYEYSTHKQLWKELLMNIQQKTRDDGNATWTAVKKKANSHLESGPDANTVKPHSLIN